jgi:hypothetical protein
MLQQLMLLAHSVGKNSSSHAAQTRRLNEGLQAHGKAVRTADKQLL